MIDETASELRTVILRLGADAGELALTHAEIGSVVGLPEGAWPMDVPRQWAPGLTGRQERRLRRLAEVCAALVHSRGARAAAWLRRTDGMAAATPLEALLTDPGALTPMRDALRFERDAAP